MTKLQYAIEIANIIEGEAKEVNKANGVIFTGVIVKNPGTNIHPTIYIDEMYDKGLTINEAVEKILEIAEMAKVDSLDIDIANFDQVKDHIRARLYHKGYLPDCDIYRSAEEYGFEDLIIVPYIEDLMKRNDGNLASARITRQIAESYNLDPDQIIDIAMENTKDDINLKSMSEMLTEIMGTPFPDDEIVNTLHVLTNKSKIFGAYAVIPALDMLKNRFGSFMVIPSSLHEVLIVPMQLYGTEEDVKTMIQEINENELKQEDILSDHPYFF